MRERERGRERKKKAKERVRGRQYVTRENHKKKAKQLMMINKERYNQK